MSLSAANLTSTANTPTQEDDPCKQATPELPCANDRSAAFNLQEWRQLERRRLIGVRKNMAPRQRAQVTGAISQFLERLLGGATGQTISFCWPFKGEPDLRELMARLSKQNNIIALPVVEERNQPLMFKSWQPGEALDRGVWDIPVPRAGKTVLPDIVLAPVVGFDPCGFRLGYGGGYFDRTLAAMEHNPIKYGVAYTIGRIATIHPQTHDIPMNAVVTESGVMWPQLQQLGMSAPSANLSGLGSRNARLPNRFMRRI